MAKIVEFLLWDNCNNNCKFCFLKNKNKLNSFLEAEERKYAIESAHAYLNSASFESGSDVLLCGGELFDTAFTPAVKSAWKAFLSDLIQKTTCGVVQHIYVNTNLIYDIDLELNDFLAQIDAFGLFPKLNFTTSYDPIGRYRTKEDLQRFFNNVAELHKRYPALTIIANTIMTRAVCDLILDGQLSVAALQSQHNIIVNLIPYIILTDDLAPTKEMVMETLRAVDREIPGYLVSYIPRFSVDHPRVLLKYYHGGLKEVTTENNPCGHSINFAKYTKGNSCFVCDILQLTQEA